MWRHRELQFYKKNVNKPEDILVLKTKLFLSQNGRHDGHPSTITILSFSFQVDEKDLFYVQVRLSDIYVWLKAVSALSGILVTTRLIPFQKTAHVRNMAKVI